MVPVDILLRGNSIRLHVHAKLTFDLQAAIGGESELEVAIRTFRLPIPGLHDAEAWWWRWAN